MIVSSEERSKAGAAIALHFAAQGQVEEANRIAGNVIVEHWKEWIHTHLEMLEGGPAVQVSPGHRRPAEVTVTAPPEDTINSKSLSEAVEAVISQGAITEELYIVCLAAQDGHAETAARTARQFWQAKDARNNTHLDRISEQPRHLSLRELRQAGPLLRLSLREGEAEEMILVIQKVSSWWP